MERRHNAGMHENIFNKIRREEFINFNSDKLSDFFENQKTVSEKLINDYISLKNNLDLIKKENEELRLINKELEDKVIIINNQNIKLRNKLFGKSSEKSNKNKDTKSADNQISENKNKKKKRRDKVKLLPSERYPDAPLIERDIEFEKLPTCACCQEEMRDSGMTEDSEYITVIPKKIIIIRQLRHKYRCAKCHGDIKTAPCPKRIIPGSSYGDDIIIDVAMSKYNDLIPIERYASIAGREGLKDLPANSLVDTTHGLADIAEDAYHMVGEECLSSENLNADETSHKMLEEHGDKSWYLWGFSTPESCYFEIHNTRSGDISSDFLSKSKCLYLISDAYSGYAKSVNDTNKIREKLGLAKIKNVYCNAHCRRYFKDAIKNFPEEVKYFIDQYKNIYKLDSEGKADIFVMAQKRAEMKPLFEEMKNKSEEFLSSVSDKSELAKAIKYLLNNYEELTLFLTNPTLPIDNNSQERLLRSPVIGRKTWYGTHSKRGAKTAAILFTLVESCKLNNINPREYFKRLVQHIHDGKGAFTPKQYKSMEWDSC